MLRLFVLPLSWHLLFINCLLVVIFVGWFFCGLLLVVCLLVVGVCLLSLFCGCMMNWILRCFGWVGLFVC